MDEADYAQITGEFLLEQAIKAHSRRTGTHLGEAEAPAGVVRRPDRSGGANCIDCGAAIHPKRLEAYPAAERCIGCQSRMEARR